VVSDDQIYRMNYQHMLKTHIESKADATIAALPVHREAAEAFGIMRIDETNAVGVREVGTTNTVMRIKSCLTNQTEQTGAGARKPDVGLVVVVIRAPVGHREP